jgi:hypothetical protein
MDVKKLVRADAVASRRRSYQDSDASAVDGIVGHLVAFDRSATAVNVDAGLIATLNDVVEYLVCVAAEINAIEDMDGPR